MRKRPRVVARAELFDDTDLQLLRLGLRDIEPSTNRQRVALNAAKRRREDVVGFTFRRLHDETATLRFERASKAVHLVPRLQIVLGDDELLLLDERLHEWFERTLQRCTAEVGHVLEEDRDVARRKLAVRHLLLDVFHELEDLVLIVCRRGPHG